ncbi:hypothetical protein AXK11_03910 [Cephaloticoccus primus]|uniref:Protein-export membrane protein SecG n=1 Tax=Cephaloticoccus primus TaxID=1548207 RepID=A0A139SPQ9_9BACT|nr:preprotein translocase subunit SecG [Cephaloticoccus primus]KXU36512.1 hypothetical protein AXK11_03910 [Cephaloticoccus primus]
MSILLGILTFVLILVSVALVLLVLMQKAKNDGGAGAVLGGGMTESTFGADTGNVLSKTTINATIAFFVLSFALYLGHLYQNRHGGAGGSAALPTIEAEVGEAGAAPNVGLPGFQIPLNGESPEATNATSAAPAASDNAEAATRSE